MMQCSVTCGEGIQTRTMVCYDVDNEVEVDMSFCTDEADLETERVCTGPPCPCKDILIMEIYLIKVIVMLVPVVVLL